MRYLKLIQVKYWQIFLKRKKEQLTNINNIYIILIIELLGFQHLFEYLFSVHKACKSSFCINALNLWK